MEQHRAPSHSSLPPVHANIAPFVRHAANAASLAAIDRVFFASSNTNSFASERDRHAFRERWLGRYLERFPSCCLVATTGDDAVIGYLVGSLDDPARDPTFADLPHFQRFSDVTPHYPAQLHVNLHDDWRGRGIGTSLIDAFVAHADSAGSPGVHAITSRGARNVAFYAANGFAEVSHAAIDGKDLVFLGRSLARRR